MSYDYPNGISSDAYETIIRSGVPTSIGNIPFNEVIFYSMTGPNFYGNNTPPRSLGDLSSFSESTVLFMFTDVIENYTNRDMGNNTVDIGGVGVWYDSTSQLAKLCPLDANGNFLTQYAGSQLNTPSYAEVLGAGSVLTPVMAYYNGQYVPTLALGADVDAVNYPDAYLKAHYTYGLNYFTQVGNDIFEYALFGKYWNNKEIAPQNDEGGGGGSGLPTDEQLTMPDLPTDGALASKMISAYNMSTNEIESLGQYLWSNNFFDNILKNFTSPFENIISLHTLPINPLLVASHADTIKIGNLSSGINSHKVNTDSQYIELDFGNINIAEAYKTFADLETRVTLFLPYVGYSEIDVTDCMNGYIHVTYRVDILTGDFIAVVESDSNYNTHWGVEYHIIEQKTGNMASPIPISGTNYMNMFTSAIGVVGAATSHNVVGAVETALNMKPQYSKASNLGGNVGRLGYTKPYVLLHRPSYVTPDQFEHKVGILSNITKPLSVLTGFIQVKKGTFKGANIPCTQAELNMIIEALETGVITNED